MTVLYLNPCYNKVCCNSTVLYQILMSMMRCLSDFFISRLEDALEVLIKTGRLPEASFFARTYLPSQISR